ncbi:MAG: carboxypeptidase-like regulatory domain-containing protein [Deltaproteobacteria bacterium]|nr:carboxypeptidase-like regulatory domain-containing protein [Deltaproteobacteria bacterium]
MRFVNLFVWGVIASLAVSVACGGGNSNADAGPDRTQVEPSDVRGTIWGEVVDAATGAPLEGATIVLALGDLASDATSDASGSFSFLDVPAGGQAGVTITKEGYTRVTLAVAIPGANGDFPTDNIGAFVGPVGLFPLTGSVEVQVVGFDSTPIDAATGSATASVAYVNGNIAMGRVTVTAASASGNMRFQGLPSLQGMALWGGNVDVVIGPVDLDGDGQIDYQGTADSRSAQWLLTHGGRFTIELPPPGGSTSLSALASNVGSLLNGGLPRPGDSVIGLNGPIRVVYNQPLDEGSLVATVFDDEGRAVVESTAEVREGNVVQVTPNAPFSEGRKYHVLIDVRAAGTTAAASKSRLSGSFFTAAPAGDVIIGTNYRMIDNNGNGLLDAFDVIEITLNQEIGLGNRPPSGNYWFPFYFNDDLDNSGVKGDFQGEWESNNPIPAYQLETAPLSPFLSSGFTRTFRLQMPYSPRLPAYGLSQNISKPVILNFSGTEPGYVNLVDPQGHPIITPASSEALVVTFQ